MAAVAFEEVTLKEIVPLEDVCDDEDIGEVPREEDGLTETEALESLWVTDPGMVKCEGVLTGSDPVNEILEGRGNDLDIELLTEEESALAVEETFAAEADAEDLEEVRGAEEELVPRVEIWELRGIPVPLENVFEFNIEEDRLPVDADFWEE